MTGVQTCALPIYVPFDKLVEELRPERVAGRHPLVQALFVMQNTPKSVQEFGGLKCGPVGVTSRSRFDLVLFVNNPEADPFTTWMYNPAVFDQAGISALAELYVTILRAVVADPEITLSSLYAALESAKQQDRAARQKQFQAASRQGLATIRRKLRSNVPVVT